MCIKMENRNTVEHRGERGRLCQRLVKLAFMNATKFIATIIYDHTMFVSSPGLLFH
jgi:hypothetical protein